MEKQIIQEGRKKYIIDNERDFAIFNSVKKLEKKNISKEDKMIVKLIKTQLEKDWRKYLLSQINKLVRRYK